SAAFRARNRRAARAAKEADRAHRALLRGAADLATGTPHSRRGVSNLLVNVDVDDLDKAIRFYCDAFDLRIGRRFEGAAELLGAAAPIYLLSKAPGTRATPRSNEKRRYERHWTPVHLDFVVDDVERALARAAKAGATTESEVQTHAWGRIALLADPFGNGFCLLQFTGRGYDEIAK